MFDQIVECDKVKAETPVGLPWPSTPASSAAATAAHLEFFTGGAAACPVHSHVRAVICATPICLSSFSACPACAPGGHSSTLCWDAFVGRPVRVVVEDTGPWAPPLLSNLSQKLEASWKKSWLAASLPRRGGGEQRWQQSGESVSARYRYSH